MKKKSIGIGLFFIFLTIMFFSYEVLITFDSSHYLWLTSLLSPEGDFTTWDVARGPIFPLFIRTTNIIFGKNVNGLLMSMYIFYVIMLVAYYFMHRDIIKNIEVGKKTKIIYGVLFVVLIVLNPMVVGFYHTLLTEFFALTFAALGCYLTWKWIDIDFKESKLKYILYTAFFAISITLLWLLKQPYATAVLFPLLIAAFISIITKFNLKNIIQRGITLIICVVVLFSGIKSWEAVLKACNVEINQARTSSGFFAKGIIDGLRKYNYVNRNINYNVEMVKNDEHIKDEDKEKMINVLNNQSEYKSFIIMDCNEEFYKIIYSRQESISTGDSLGFLMSEIFTHPVKIAKNYVINYLATISVLETEDMVITRNFDFESTKEIGGIGNRILEYGIDNTYPLSEEYDKYAEDYKVVNRPNTMINRVLRVIEFPCTVAMKTVFIILPFIAVFSIVLVFITKSKYDKKYKTIVYLVAILLNYSFLHILMHSTLGCIIDRYTIPALPSAYIGFFLLGYLLVRRKKYRIEENSNKKINKEKV